MIAALFVETAGIYSTIPDVDVWGIERDARSYDGPHPVVAHPPCDRWGRFWSSDGSTYPGEDGGCFASALLSVHRFGGVIEHPEGSHAWDAFGLPAAVIGRWMQGAEGWATCVAQRNYGHRARKLTWLYVAGDACPPDLDWSPPAPQEAYLSQPGRCSAGRPRRRCSCSRCEQHFGAEWLGREPFKRMGPKENAATPRPFADLLIGLAKGSHTKRAAA